jgi:hypothetical protein
MANAPIDRGPVLEKIDAAFTARDAGYDTTWPGYTARLELLNKRMNERIAAHAALPISQQISLEAQWLINYTDDWARATATLDRLEASLGGGNQPFEQQPDGSWGAGSTEFYRKLEPTVDFLQSNEIQKPKPGEKLTLLSLAFMKPLQDPGFVTSYLDRIRVSRISQTGRNNRDEFGSMITSLAQIFFKKKLKFAFDEHPEAEFTVSDASVANLRDYLWHMQSSVTGYWGPTYDFDGEVIEVQDLSFTFHVVKYYTDGGRRHDLPNTDKIIDTTQTIETFRYPNGLKPDQPDAGPALFSDHNNYDLVTMFQLMWPSMLVNARTHAGKEIETLLDWCLTTSLQGDSFAPSKDMSTVNSYYYGVQFLLVAGFWPHLPPFWTNGGPLPVPPAAPQPAALAKRLLDKFKADVDDKSDAAQGVISTLNDALGGPPVA